MIDSPSDSSLGDGDSPPEPVRHTFDWQTVDPSNAVVRTVAAVTDQDPTEATPLFSSIDPDALDAIVCDMQRGQVNFAYSGVDVSVQPDGTVTVAPKSTT